MAQINIFWYKPVNLENYELSYCSDSIQSLLYSEGAYGAERITIMTAHNTAENIKVWQIPERAAAFKGHNSLIFRSYAIKFAVGGVTPPAGAPTAIVDLSGDEFTYFIDTNEQGNAVTLEIADRNDNSLAVLTADELNGNADFNVSGIVCSLFANDMSNDYNLTGAETKEKIKELYCGNVFRVKGGFFFNDTYLSGYIQFAIVNGVAQAGESIEVEGFMLHPVLLTRNTVILDKDSGPLNQYVSLLIPLEATVTGYDSGCVYSVKIDSAADAAAINALIQNQSPLKVLSFVERDDCNDLAVRWVNDIGGLDTYYFTHRQIRHNKAKTSQTRKNTYRGEKLLVLPEIAPYALDTSDILSVGKQMTKDEFALCESIIYSPFIEISWKRNVWVRVVVDNYDNTRNTDVNTIDFAVDFRLPERNNQF